MRVADRQDGLFIAMVDLNLPAVEVVLEQLFRRGLQVGTQEVGGPPVIEARTNRHFVGKRRNDDEAQKASCGTTSPEHVIKDFVTNLALFGSEADAGLLPSQAIRLADILRREKIDRIAAP